MGMATISLERLREHFHAGLSLAEDGSARFTAQLAATTAGQDIATLVTAKDPFLKNVSIRGWWLGEVRKVIHDGENATTADDLEIDGIDFTKSPGVVGAVLDSPSSQPTETVNGRTLITESVDIAGFTETVEVDMSHPTRPAAENAR